MPWSITEVYLDMKGLYKKKTERRWKKKCIIISILTDQECYNEARNSKAHSNDNLRNDDSSVPGYGCEHTLNCISLFQIYFDFIYLCLAKILKWILLSRCLENAST